VLFSNALLDALTPAEVTAILAHEMGHIEHYTRRRLLWMSLTSIGLIGFATLVLPRIASASMKPAGDPVAASSSRHAGLAHALASGARDRERSSCG
jgi:Zn-dependent protease with chaperone function